MSSPWRDALKHWVGSNVAGTFVLQIVGLGLGFGVSLTLAHASGPEVLGTYEYVLAIVGAIGPLAVVGTDKLLRREVAALVESERWGDLRHLLGWTTRTTALVSLSLAVVAGVCLYGPLRGVPGTEGATMLIGLALVPLIAWIRVGRGTLQGRHRAALSLLPEELIVPGFLLTGLAGLEIAGIALSSPVALGLRLAGAGLGLAAIGGATIRALPADLSLRGERTSRASETPAIDWWTSAGTLAVVASLGALNARVDTILLGYFESSSAVGFYAVASRVAGCVLLIFYAMNQTLSGEFSRLETAERREELRRTAQSGQWVVLAVATPVALLLFSTRGIYLSWFGPGFETASVALAMLIGGRLAATGTGLSGYLLMMTGHERVVALVEAGGILLNALLNVVLIPHYGLKGAAISTAGSFILSGAIQAYVVSRRLGFDPSIIGSVRAHWRTSET